MSFMLHRRVCCHVCLLMMQDGEESEQLSATHALLQLLPLRQLRQQAVEAGAVAVLLSQFTQVRT